MNESDDHGREQHETGEQFRCEAFAEQDQQKTLKCENDVHEVRPKTRWAFIAEDEGDYQKKAGRYLNEVERGDSEV